MSDGPESGRDASDTGGGGGHPRPPTGEDRGDPADGVVLVASAGALDPVVVLLRELLHAASAVRATAVVPDGDGPPAVVDVAQLMPVEVARGRDVVHLPHTAALDVPPPVLPEFRRLPAFDVDPGTGEVAAPLGAVEHRARATAQAAAGLPPGSVLQLAWDTSRPGVAFSVTARAAAEEPFVLGVGDETFPMPPGWPD